MAQKGKLGRGQRSNSHKEQNVAYKIEFRRDKNKRRKLRNHVKRAPNDAQAKASLALIEKGKPGVKARRAWRIKYKANKLTTNSAVYPPMMYRERIARREG